MGGGNQPIGMVGSGMRGLNTNTMPTPAASQNRLGVLGGDLAGFPNGRRPGDDVVDEALRVVMGVLLTKEQAPSGALAYTDGTAASSERVHYAYRNGNVWEVETAVDVGAASTN
jgi:hypothetical protein